jgi:undecaprenyl-diphosphatase
LNFLYNIDKSIFLFFNATLTHPLLDYTMPRITDLKFWIIPGLIAAAIFVIRSIRAKETKKAFIVLGLIALTVAISDPVSSQILKKLFARPRPCNPDFFVEGGRFLLGMWGSRSFPSSHSMNMFAVATLLTCFYPKRWMYFIAFASLIGYTRVYCGVHYPFDVLGGAVFGAGVGVGVYFAFWGVVKKIKKSKSKSKSFYGDGAPPRNAPI